MSLTINPLRAAVFQRLLGNVVVSTQVDPVLVRQAVERGTLEVPYVTSGFSAVRRVDQDAYEVTLQLEVYSPYRGQKEVDEILQAMHAELLQTPLVVSPSTLAVVLDKAPDAVTFTEEGFHNETVQRGTLTLTYRLYQTS